MIDSDKHIRLLTGPSLSSPPSSPSLRSFLIMIPLYLSLAALSCLSFAGAEPFHIPLVKKRSALSVNDYAIAADVSRIKYGYPHSSTSKRQNTAAVSVINQVCPHFSHNILT